MRNVDLTNYPVPTPEWKVTSELKWIPSKQGKFFQWMLIQKWINAEGKDEWVPVPQDLSGEVRFDNPLPFNLPKPRNPYGPGYKNRGKTTPRRNAPSKPTTPAIPLAGRGPLSGRILPLALQKHSQVLGKVQQTQEHKPKTTVPHSDEAQGPGTSAR